MSGIDSNIFKYWVPNPPTPESPVSCSLPSIQLVMTRPRRTTNMDGLLNPLFCVLSYLLLITALITVNGENNNNNNPESNTCAE